MLSCYNVPWFWFLNTCVISALLPRPGCSRHGVIVHCMCVQILSFCATRWPVLPECMQLTLVSWYVLVCYSAIVRYSFGVMLCRCKRLTLSRVWFLCATVQIRFCMAESWTRRLSLWLACKPFPGLCACTRTGRWCASVVAVRSLSLVTNRADRHSQINSLDLWCATCVSKTLDVVHRYALLVSNSNML